MKVRGTILCCTSGAKVAHQNPYLKVCGTFKVATKVTPAAIWAVLQFPLVPINTKA